jgi:hypothetical protein
MMAAKIRKHGEGRFAPLNKRADRKIRCIIVIIGFHADERLIRRGARPLILQEMGLIARARFI